MSSLILSRTEGETIVIGNDIKVTVTEVSGGKVRLRVEAPLSVTVNRQEVHDALKAVKPATAATAATADSRERPHSARPRSPIVPRRK